MPREAPPLPPEAAFTVTRLIRFSHTDPAGIVYFPEYFDMCNALIEDWLGQELELDYPTLTLKDRLATPIVHAECDFFAPSRWGERLHLALLVPRVGRSSLTYRILGHAGGKVRLEARIVVAFVHLDSGKPLPLPDGLRQKIEAYRAKTEGTG
jgi:4-hydroxybenzoyl-CoA thioesterase